MPGLLGTPTFAKMSVDAFGRLWRRLKGKKEGSKKVLEQVVEETLQQAPEQASEQASEQAPEQAPKQDQQAFSSDSADSTESTISELDPLECFERIQGWVDGTDDTYNFFSAWRHPSEPSSIISADDEADRLLSAANFAADPIESAFLVEPAELNETAELNEPAELIEPVKPAKRGIKNAFKSVKAVFKQRNSSG